MLLAMALGLALLFVGCGGGGGAGTTPSGSGEVFTQAAGEIFLEPAGDPGPESFAGDALVFDHAVPSPTSMSILTTLPTLPGAPVQVASFLGGTPGLYGGSRSKLIADKDAQLTFLQANLDKAAAWVAALNADPTLRWSQGTQVTVDQLAAYFAELTPVLITRDIRVTNHGFRDGRPTPRQSILQAGQYVLVDIFGVPRARCECGNPLIPPMAVSTKPKYTGKPWPGFDPTIVIVVQPAATEIDSFVLIDVETGQTFERGIGSSGDKDADRTTTTTVPPTTSTMSTTTTTSVDKSPVAANELNGPWEGTFTITQANVDESQASGNEAGCAIAALAQALGQPLPMTLDVTMNPDGKGGTAMMFIDMSQLDLGEGASASSEPQSMQFTYANNVLTFNTAAASSQGFPTTMTAKVSRGPNGVLLMTGAMVVGDPAVMGMKAEFQLNKQLIM
jgi:hypothetical protein